MLDYELAKLRNKGFRNDIISKVRDYYLKVVKEGWFHGKSYRLIFYTVLLLVLRLFGFPATFNYISEISGLDKDKIYHLYSDLKDKLKLNVAPVNPEALIEFYASQLNLSEKEIEQAKNIISMLKAEKLTMGRSPLGLAAAATYSVVKIDLLKKKLLKPLEFQKLLLETLLSS